MFTYWDHIGTMFWPYFGPCFGYFYNIYASRCLKWLKFSTTAAFLELAKFFSMDTLEFCGDLLQPGGQLETPGLVCPNITILVIVSIYLCQPKNCTH